MEKKSLLNQENSLDFGLESKLSIEFDTHPILHIASLLSTNGTPYIRQVYIQGFREGLLASGKGALPERVKEMRDLKKTALLGLPPHNTGYLNGLIIGINYMTKTETEIVSNLDSFN